VLGLTWSLFLIKCLNLSGFSQVSSGNGHQFNTCYDEIEVCAHACYIIYIEFDHYTTGMAYAIMFSIFVSIFF